MTHKTTGHEHTGRKPHPPEENESLRQGEYEMTFLDAEGNELQPLPRGTGAPTGCVGVVSRDWRGGYTAIPVTTKAVERYIGRYDTFQEAAEALTYFASWLESTEGEIVLVRETGLEWTGRNEKEH